MNTTLLLMAQYGRGVHVQDLAAYLDQQREAARKEFEKINGRP